MFVGLGVAVEEAPHERDERDPLQIGFPLHLRRFLLFTQQCLEAMSVSQRFRRERRYDLTKSYVRVGEWFRVAIGAQEYRTDGVRLPLNRYHDDGTDVPRVERALDAPEGRIIDRIRNEYRFSRFERALQLRISIEVDDQVANGGILVARHQPDFILLAREEDGAAIEAERFAQLARDSLENVDEVKGGGDLLEDVDDGRQVIAFALQLRYARAESEQLIIPPSETLRRCRGRPRRPGWSAHRLPKGVR